MNQRNCPNCGAPYDVKLNKCPYCGTSYYDLSALDIDAQEPFYLKIKSVINGKPCYITQLVRPMQNMSMEWNMESTDVMGYGGSRLGSFVRNQTLTTNLTFQAVPSGSNKELCTIEVVT